MGIAEFKVHAAPFCGDGTVRNGAALGRVGTPPGSAPRADHMDEAVRPTFSLQQGTLHRPTDRRKAWDLRR